MVCDQKRVDRTSNIFSLLLVDDNIAARDLIARVVGWGFPKCTIYTADNGREGVDLFRKYSPDIVVTDLQMPVMNGIEMAREIKDINPHATPIVISAHNEKHYIEAFKEIGDCTYLVKPVDMETLLEAIRRCLPHAPNEAVNYVVK